MKQFEIWWADLADPIGRRPVLILTRTRALRYLSRCMVSEVTSRVRGLAVEVRLGAAEGLRRECAANFDNIHAVSIESLTSRIGVLDPARVAEAKRALGHALDWPELMEP